MNWFRCSWAYTWFIKISNEFVDQIHLLYCFKWRPFEDFKFKSCTKSKSSKFFSHLSIWLWYRNSEAFFVLHLPSEISVIIEFKTAICFKFHYDWDFEIRQQMSCSYLSTDINVTEHVFNTVTIIPTFIDLKLHSCIQQHEIPSVFQQKYICHH